MEWARLNPIQMKYRWPCFGDSVSETIKTVNAPRQTKFCQGFTLQDASDSLFPSKLYLHPWYLSASSCHRQQPSGLAFSGFHCQSFWTINLYIASQGHDVSAITRTNLNSQGPRAGHHLRSTGSNMFRKSGPKVLTRLTEMSIQRYFHNLWANF